MTLQTASTGKWLIKGTLMTASPLQIGCGDTTVRDKILVNQKTGANIEINAVITTGRDKPAYIPGSTIKGNLRAWLKGANADGNILEQIFGSEDPKKKGAVGGKAEFHDAFINNPLTFDDGNDKRPPYWSETRQTGVSVSVTIDRQTGTAREQRLFHEEFVPAGVQFDLAISGQDLTREEVGHLLHALQIGCSVGANTPLTMGSGTADGFGMFTWQLEQVCELHRDGIVTWINEGCKESGTDVIARHGTLYNFSDFAEAPFKISEELTIGLDLKFAGSFLVNDSSRVVKSSDKKKKTADSRPLLDHNGLPTLPGSAFRGAFRSHAERIIRTVGGWACRVDDLNSCCNAIAEATDITSRCLACRMFGAPGWKTLVEIAPFTLATSQNSKFNQDFIAVDRFTGGVKEGAKFDAESILNPHFTGKLKIDASRIEPWQIGLLVLLLRDLEEGDITFGFGSSKGYGACEATVAGFDISLLCKLERFQHSEFIGKDNNEIIDACITSFIKVCTPVASGKVEG